MILYAFVYDYPAFFPSLMNLQLIVVWKSDSIFFNCPTAMIFVPSRDGVNPNVRDFTALETICVGADVPLQAILEKTEVADG